ncbi:trypsin delta-like [Periplaneta americana]|uniref:trypsin delta-like n=1 Tax=Periplaneta americana TaxID=6978 RepID=UPI0037E9BB23
MFRLIIAVCLFYSCFGAILKPKSFHFDGRIVGGSPADISNYPYQISFEYFGHHRCGAAIVSPDWVVTAGHCADGTYVEYILLRAGSSYKEEGGSEHTATEYFIHPDYDGNMDHPNYDIAVIKVSNPFVYSSTVQPLSLPALAPEVGTSVVVTGWGRLVDGGPTPTQLQQVEVNIVDFDECNKDYDYLGGISSVMICAGVPAGGKDACNGDSGGPLVSSGQLVGVVSWGEGCAQAGYPGVYADVAALKVWVTSVTGLN